MSYNKKVWCSVLIFCTLFWLAVIVSINSLSKSNFHSREHNPQEQIVNQNQKQKNQTGTVAVLSTFEPLS